MSSTKSESRRTTLRSAATDASIKRDDVRYRTDFPLGAHRGSVPPATEILARRGEPTNDCTYTSLDPDSRAAYATSCPSGEITGAMASDARASGRMLAIESIGAT